MSKDGNGIEGAFISGEDDPPLLVDMIPTLVWRAGPDGFIEYVNKRVLDYFGAALGEITGWGWADRVHPEDVAFKVKSWLTNLETENPHDVVCRFRGPSGQYRWFNVCGEPLRASDGRVLRWCGVLIDVDDQKRTEEALRESDDKLRQILDTVPGLTWSTGQIGRMSQLQASLNAIPAYTWYTAPSGALIFVNKRTADYLGLAEDHPLRFGIDVGAPWDAHIPLLHPADQEESRKVWAACLSTGEAAEFRQRVPDAQGDYHWFLSRAEPLRASDGALLHWVGVNLEIEDFMRSERALRESEYKLRQIVETVPSLIWSSGPDGEPTHINQRLLDYSGMRFEDFKLRGWEAFVHPADYSETEKAYFHAMQAGTAYEGEMRLRRADGEYRWHHARCEPLRDGEGNIIQWYGLSVDVEERKQTEVLLRRSEAYLSEAQSLSHAGSSAYNQTTLFHWSEENYRIFEFDPRDGIPSYKAVLDRFHPDDRERVREVTRRAVEDKKDYKLEYRIQIADGTIKYIEGKAHPKFSESGELVEVVATVLDVTERKRAEEVLQASEEKFRDYAETASDWFWETGPDHKFTLLTENAFGSQAVDRIGTPCWGDALDLETEREKWRLMRETLEFRKPFRDFVYCSARRNGSPIHVNASGKPVFDADGEFRGYRGTGTDVTALVLAREEHERLRQLESDLAHMNRVSVMGELAASLSHEITQPIAAARNNARAAMHFLDRNAPDLDEIREAIASVVDDADRAGDIIDRIRDHIKKAPPRKARFALNKAISEVIGLAQSAIATNGVSVATHFTKALALVEGDRVQLQQVVLNLILNAVEAMSMVDDRVRQLSISTEQIKTGGVLVSVHDSGPGIDPDHLDQVFQAFYTTKASGVGMGLSISRSIIDAHGGRLWADTNVSGGAVFRFSLPSEA